MKIKKENNVLATLIRKLQVQKQSIWKAVAVELARPRRSKVEVNLSKIDEYSDKGAIVLVPGKVLGAGSLSKSVKVAAFNFSESARKLIEASGSKMMTIEELLAENPEGTGVVILK